MPPPRVTVKDDRLREDCEDAVDDCSTSTSGATPPTEAAVRHIEKPQLKSKAKRSKQRRCKSSSPEKVKRVQRQPSIRLPQLADSSCAGRGGKIIDAASKQCLPSTKPIGDVDDLVDAPVKIGDTGQPSSPSISRVRPSQNPQPQTLWNPTVAGRYVNSLGARSDIRNSPDTSPTSNSIYQSPIAAAVIASGSSSSSSFDDSTELPHYACFFRPRLPQDNGSAAWQSPIPPAKGIDHALAIKEELTRFHLGVLLADEEAGQDRYRRFLGLRKAVEECMPGLTILGVQRHQIVFFYHGQGENRIGNEVWSAIEEWELKHWGKLKNTFRNDSENDHNRPNAEAVQPRGSKKDMGKNKEQERSLRQREGVRQGVEKQRIRYQSKEAKRWNDFAKCEETRSRIRQGNGL